MYYVANTGGLGLCLSTSNFSMKCICQYFAPAIQLHYAVHCHNDTYSNLSSAGLSFDDKRVDLRNVLAVVILEIVSKSSSSLSSSLIV